MKSRKGRQAAGQLRPNLLRGGGVKGAPKECRRGLLEGRSGGGQRKRWRCLLLLLLLLPLLLSLLLCRILQDVIKGESPRPAWEKVTQRIAGPSSERQSLGFTFRGAMSLGITRPSSSAKAQH